MLESAILVFLRSLRNGIILLAYLFLCFRCFSVDISIFLLLALCKLGRISAKLETCCYPLCLSQHRKCVDPFWIAVMADSGVATNEENVFCIRKVRSSLIRRSLCAVPATVDASMRQALCHLLGLVDLDKHENLFCQYLNGYGVKTGASCHSETRYCFKARCGCYDKVGLHPRDIISV